MDPLLRGSVVASVLQEVTSDVWCGASHCIVALCLTF
jgi:hypothetical protein